MGFTINLYLVAWLLDFIPNILDYSSSVLPLELRRGISFFFDQPQGDFEHPLSYLPIPFCDFCWRGPIGISQRVLIFGTLSPDFYYYSVPNKGVESVDRPPKFGPFWKAPSFTPLLISSSPLSLFLTESAQLPWPVGYWVFSHSLSITK